MSFGSGTRFVLMAIVATVAAFAIFWTYFHQGRSLPTKPGDDWGNDFNADLKYLVEQSLDRLDRLPGLGLAIVTEDKAIFVGGFGYADVLDKTPVTAKTQFYIASSTKAFTAMALESADREGAFDLDRTLAEAAPGVGFDTAIHAEDVTLRQMLLHTAGIHSDGISFRQTQSGEWNPDAIWQLMEYLRPNERAPLGTFDYTNSGYNIATTVYTHETGQSWQELVQEQILDSAGLRDTSAKIDEAREHGVLAKPYFAYPPTTEPMRRGPIETTHIKHDDTMQSAGGLIMSVEDAAAWIKLNLQNGEIDGEHRLDTDIVKFVREPSVTANVLNPFSFPRQQYGMGWFIGDYDGKVVIDAPGSFSGYAATLSFSPERGLGVAVMINEPSLGMPFAYALSKFAYDWHAEPHAAYDLARQRIDEIIARDRSAPIKLRLQRIQLNARKFRLTEPMDAYFGTFKNSEYGTLHVSQEGSDLFVQIGYLRAKATGFNRENWVRVELVPFEGTTLQFYVDEGQVHSVGLFGERFERIL